MKTRRFLLLAIILLATGGLAVFAIQRYQAANRGKLLVKAHFDPRPPEGYGTRRALRLAAATDPTTEILNQGIRYHQQGAYDLSLVSLRAYFSDAPQGETSLPAVLGASAAIAAGAWTEVPFFVDKLPPAHTARYWFTALVYLQNEELVLARRELERLASMPANRYPSADLLHALSTPE